MVQPLHGGVRLTAIFDSCHSGTALDLPYIYSTQGILKEPNLAKEAGQGLLGAISAYGRGDLGGVASNVFGFLKKATNGDDAYNRTMATKTSPADVVMLSGSKDDQTSFVYPISLSIIPFECTCSQQITSIISYHPPFQGIYIYVYWKGIWLIIHLNRADATIASQATGAMSWAFITALKKNPQQSYVQLLNSIRDELQTRYTQKPQLSCSHPLSETYLIVPFQH